VALLVRRVLRGVKEKYRIRPSILETSEFLRLDKMQPEIKEIFEGMATYSRGKEANLEITGPVTLIDKVLEMGRKGVSVQRYKGLGEMNPEQLWETTLDPEVRSLLQVKVEHLDSANEIFSTLMGDVVEPRRDFIQDNALKVRVLDA